MMNKVFLNIIVSATGNRIELKVSPKIKVGQLTLMIKDYLKDTDSAFVPNETARLCDGRRGMVYPYNVSLSELQISDGQEMLLI